MPRRSCRVHASPPPSPGAEPPPAQVLAVARADGATPGRSPAWTGRSTARSEFRLLDIEEATERRVVERGTDEEARPYTAVVVEDHPHIVQLVHMSLRRSRCARPDGLKGLELVLRERPSLVVTDLIHRCIDGLALTRRLREEPTTRHIPIIMLTARGELEDRAGDRRGAPTSPSPSAQGAADRGRGRQGQEQTADSSRSPSAWSRSRWWRPAWRTRLNPVMNALGRVLGLCGEALGAAAGAGPGRPAFGPDHSPGSGRLRREAHRLHRRADEPIRPRRLQARDGPARRLGAARTVVGIVLPATGRHVKVDLDVEGDGSSSAYWFARCSPT